MKATIDQIAMLPLYAAAATAVLAFITDLIAAGRRGPVLAVTALGATATAVTAWIIGAGRDPRQVLRTGRLFAGRRPDRRARRRAVRSPDPRDRGAVGAVGSGWVAGRRVLRSCWPRR